MLILMVGPGGYSFAFGKSVLTATIRYILEQEFGEDTTVDIDRDKDLTARTDPFIASAKETFPPKEYEEHCDRAYTAHLDRALSEHGNKLVLLNGDWSRQVGRPAIQTALQQIIAGTYPERTGTRNISSIICTCDPETQRLRMVKRAADRDKKYIEDESLFNSENDARKKSDGNTLEHLSKCGITEICSVNTSKTFPTKEVVLSKKLTKILDVDNYEVRAYIESIVSSLKLRESMLRLGHTPKPKTPVDAISKIETASSPIPVVGRTRSGSGDRLGGRSRTYSDAQGDIDDFALGLSLQKTATVSETTSLPTITFKQRRNSESDLRVVQRQLMRQTVGERELIDAETAFMGPVHISATYAKTLMGVPLDVVERGFPGSRKSSVDTQASETEMRAATTPDESGIMGTVPIPTSDSVQKLSESMHMRQMPLDTTPVDLTPPSSKSSAESLVSPVKPKTAEPKTEGLRKRRRKHSDDSSSSKESTQEVVNRHVRQRASSQRQARKRERESASEEGLTRDEAIKRARAQGLAAREQSSPLYYFHGQHAPLGLPTPLHRVTSEGSLSCRSEAGSPRDAVSPPPVTFDGNRLR